MLIEDRLVFGIVDLSGVRRLGRVGAVLFGRTGENIQMRATKPFSLSETTVFRNCDQSGIR